MSAFILKLIAIITMSVDHIGYIANNSLFCNYIGRISLPIFAFQISEGYIHTKNLKNYFLRLFIFALVSQLPFMLFYKLVGNGFVLNVFFTLLLGLFSIYIYDKDKSKFKILGIISFVLIGFLAQYTHCDYGFYGITIIFLFFVLKSNITKASIAFLLATAIKYIIYILKYGYSTLFVYLMLSTMSSIVFISLYNGKKGKDTKYLLYLFYPIHLLIIYGISFLLNSL